MSLQNFSDPTIAKSLLKKIQGLAESIDTLKIMEVCGTHTMAIGRLGLRKLLPDNIKLLSGPGCPVCVTPAEIIDTAIYWSKQPQTTVVTFGDLIRVPGSSSSLEKAQSQGGSVEIITTPLQVIDRAKMNPHQNFVLIAVGFETTIPAFARTVELCDEQKIENVKILPAHRTLPNALTALCSDPSIEINAFILPGHVSAILGADAYVNIPGFHLPASISGFEPLDILKSLLSVLEMVTSKRVAIVNDYTRIVKPEGNPFARELINKVYKPCDALWRGIGVIPGSGLMLQERYAHFLCPSTTSESTKVASMPKGCSCGQVLRGVIQPSECPLFASICTPENPIGPCMVSSEGSCAAYYRYERN